MNPFLAIFAHELCIPVPGFVLGPVFHPHQIALALLLGFLDGD